MIVKFMCSVLEPKLSSPGRVWSSSQSPNMIQRCLVRQSRAILPTLHPLSRPSSVSPFSSPRIPITSAFLRPKAPRCYSTTPAEADTPVNPEVPASEQTNPDAKEEEDPSKKELEAKNREIIDLKVRLANPSLMRTITPSRRTWREEKEEEEEDEEEEEKTIANPPVYFLDRINIFAPSPNFVTSKSVRNVTSKPAVTLPSPALLST